MKILDLEQGSVEWNEFRAGKVTGSRCKDIFKKDNSAFMDLLISEKLTGYIEQFYVSEAMQRGIDTEPVARSEYIDETGENVYEVGICQDDERDFLACSPDGLVYHKDFDINGPDGLEELTEPIGAIEIKCPAPKNHVKYMRSKLKAIMKDYKYQILNYFIVCETIEWLDFVSFDPRVEIKPIFIHRITRKELIDDLLVAERQIDEFHEKMEAEYNEIIF